MDLFKKSITVWELDGRRVPSGTPGAAKVVTKSTKWYAKLDGKQIALSASKDTSHRMFRKLASDAELRSVGLVDPFEQHRDKPLLAHLDDFRVALVSKGNTAKHVNGTLKRIEAAIEGCGFVKLDDLEQGKVSSWLTDQRKPRPMVEIPPGDRFTPSQAAAVLGITLSGVQKLAQRHNLPASGAGKNRRLHRQALEMMAERMAQGKSPETVNHYVRSLRGFGSFLERSDRVRRSPFKGLSLLNTQVDVRHSRRELTTEELRRLLEGTRQCNRSFRGLTGEDRAALYLTAAATGFRARALAHLTTPDFDLRSNLPTVTLAARYNKSKKPKVQPLPPEAATALSWYLQDKPISKPVWGTSWLDRGADMIRLDLEAVGIPYVVEGTNGPAFCDFHGLRYTFLTLLGKAGVDLRTAQVLAGHSTPLLTARYTHRRLDDLAGAVARLPMLTNAGSDDDEPEERPGRVKRGGNKQLISADMAGNKGDSEGNHQIRNPLLYPAELRAHMAIV